MRLDDALNQPKKKQCWTLYAYGYFAYIVRRGVGLLGDDTGWNVQDIWQYFYKYCTFDLAYVVWFILQHFIDYKMQYYIKLKKKWFKV